MSSKFFKKVNFFMNLFQFVAQKDLS